MEMVNVRRYVTRVSSDNAWIDDGERVDITYWDAEKQVTETRTFCPGDIQSLEVDASPETLAIAAQYQATVAWIQETYWKVRFADRLEVGKQVEVFKGRKVPKGIYTLVSLNKGNYGPICTLRSANGQVYNYVSQDNVRVHNPMQYANVQYAGYFVGLEGLYTKANRVPLLVLADEMDEKGDARAVHVRNYARS